MAKPQAGSLKQTRKSQEPVSYLVRPVWLIYRTEFIGMFATDAEFTEMAAEWQVERERDEDDQA
ncbi:hypothetical protein [Leptodesmis sp.]|uniref:hypothetical protein n=1 Tax=Leptodesmis sp. TaxID=3100501 RepID=UPI004053492E